MLINYSTRVTEFIARGSDLLDRHAPQGYDWPFYVDLTKLRISDWNNCVLGQLFGDYHTGYERLRLCMPATVPYDSEFSVWVSLSVMCGFEATTLNEDTGHVYATHNKYQELDVAWRAEITRLRGERSRPKPTYNFPILTTEETSTE